MLTVDFVQDLLITEGVCLFLWLVVHVDFLFLSELLDFVGDVEESLSVEDYGI